MKRAIAVCAGLLALVAPAAAESPVAVVEEVQGKVTGAVLVDVGGAVGHRLDLAGTPVRGSAGVARADVVQPVGGVNARVGRPVELIAPHQHPIGLRAGPRRKQQEYSRYEQAILLKMSRS